MAPVEVLAARGREALRVGRFKEAMEVFKQLAPAGRAAGMDRTPCRCLCGSRARIGREGHVQGSRDGPGEYQDHCRHGARATALFDLPGSPGSVPEGASGGAPSIDRAPAAEANRVAGMAAVLSLVVPTLAEAQGAKPPGGTPWLDQCCAARAALDAWLQGKPYDEVEQCSAAFLCAHRSGPYG